MKPTTDELIKIMAQLPFKVDSWNSPSPKARLRGRLDVLEEKREFICRIINYMKIEEVTDYRDILEGHLEEVDKEIAKIKGVLG